MFNLPKAKHQRHLDRYEKLITHAIENPPSGRTERHHVLPRAMGGNEDPANLVDLTPKQHFIAHYLLWKAYRNRAMARSFHFFSTIRRRKVYSRDYAAYRQDMTMSAETKRKMSVARLGMTFSEETRNKMADSARARTKNRKHSPETKAKMAETARAREAEKRQRGWTYPDSGRTKIAAAGKGRSVSQATRAKIALRLLGHPVSVETREKISMAVKARLPASSKEEMRCGQAVTSG